MSSRLSAVENTIVREIDAGGDKNDTDGDDRTPLGLADVATSGARGNSLARVAVVYVSAGKPIDFRCGAVYPRVACRLLFWLRLPYDLARVGRAEPYLTHVAVVAEVVELLRVRVLPAAARAGNRGSEKRRVMHNGCYAITVRITYYS